MKHFYIISNEQKDPGFAMARQIRDYLEEHGAGCEIRGETGDSGLIREDPQTHSRRRMYTDASLVPGQTEGVLVIGGDGTLLRAARDLISLHLPLLGINMGTLGYLAEVERRQIFPAMDRLLAGEYTREERMMLEGTAGEDRFSDLALNDIVITRSGRLRVICFNVYVDGEFLCSYRADGVIIATPTGSTGYSLSAGGPIVSPQASLLLMTAIAPHTMNSRPIILPDSVEIEIEIRDREEEGVVEATFDGNTSVALHAGDRIRVRRAKSTACLIKTRNTSFLEILREKMNHS